jgi:uncharacterized protein
MKTLSVVGTAAMFLVGGGVLTHGLPAVHHLIAGATAVVAVIPGVGTVLTPLFLDALVGILAVALVLIGVRAFARMRQMVAG